MAAGSTTVAIEAKKDHTYEITIIGALFFIMGFVTWVNGSLIAYLKIACELDNFQAFFVTLAFFISYFVMATPSGFVVKAVGYKKGMVYSLLIMALGALIFIPAANTRTYGWFLTGLFVIGSGLALLQTAVNPYVTILGPLESAGRRISIMGICNKIAGGIGTLALATLLFQNIDPIKKQLATLTRPEQLTILNDLAHRVVMPYVVIAVVLVALALMVAFSHIPEIDTDKEDADLAAMNSTKKSVFEFPNLILGAIAMFVYVGVEVIAGDSIITFGNTQNIPLDIARYFTIFTLVPMVVGYFIGVAVMPKYIKQDKALVICAILGVIFGIGIILTSGITAIVFLALLGLANSIMYPCIWPLSLDGLGRFTKLGSALLIMALSGGGILPLILARLLDANAGHTQHAYWLVLPCYAFILYYAAAGHKIKKWA